MEELDVVVNSAILHDSASTGSSQHTPEYGVETERDEIDNSIRDKNSERIDCESQYTASERRAIEEIASGPSPHVPPPAPASEASANKN